MYTEIVKNYFLDRLTRTWEVYEAMESLKIPELSGRPFELWFPLLVIAKLSGEEVYRNVLSYALEVAGKRFEEVYVEEKKLLNAIERIVYGKIRELEMQETFVKTEVTGGFTVEFQAKDVHEVLRQIMVDENKELDEREFMRKWNTQKIGIRLHRSFKLKSSKVSGGKRIYNITLEKFLELCRIFGYKPSEEFMEKIPEPLKAKLQGNVASVACVASSQRIPESQKPSEKPSEQAETPSEPTSEKPQTIPRETPHMPHSPHQTSQIKEIIVKTLSTKEASSGLKNRDIYKVLAELQKHGKLKVMVTYDTVREALEELRREGKVLEENGSWKLAQ